MEHGTIIKKSVKSFIKMVFVFSVDFVGLAQADRRIKTNDPKSTLEVND